MFPVRQIIIFQFFIINHFLQYLMIVIIVNDCTSGELSKSLESNLSSHYATSGELVTSSSAPRASSVHSLPPDLLVNTLDLKRTLRRWSQDKEQVGTARTDALSKQRNLACCHSEHDLERSISRLWSNMKA